MQLHVSPSGDDGAEGTRDAPKATLAAARDALRAAASGDERRMVVHGDEYYAANLDLGPQDSGLTVEAAEGSRPVLYGGVRVTGWRDDGDGMLAASLGGVRGGEWDFRSLVVNGTFAPRSRLPEEGVLHHEDRFESRWMSSTAGGWDVKPTNEQLTTMHYAEGDLGEWLDVRNAEVRVYHQWDESLVGVESIDTSMRTLRFSSPCTHPPGAFCRHGHSNKHSWYVVYNVREGMHAPGMWYLDRTRGMVVYRPRDGESAQTLEAVAPNSTEVIRVAGDEGSVVRGITIRGIEIQATTTAIGTGGFGGGKLSAAVSIANAVDVTLEDVVIRNVGGKAVGTSRSGCSGIRVRSCGIESCGGPGIMVRGDECSVTDCSVREVGLTYPSSVALSVLGKRCEITHNEVVGCPYSALHGGGEDTRYERNFVTDFMRELDDGAAIYVFAGKRVVYRGNVAIGGGKARGALSHGYYLDERSEDCVVEDNLAVDTGWPSHNHMAKGCTIRDNVFIDCSPTRITMMKCASFEFERNVVVADGELKISAPDGGIASLKNSVLFSRSGEVTMEHLDEGGYSPNSKEKLDAREGISLEDPRLQIDEQRRCSFGTGSSATRLGIEPQDFSGAGPRSAASGPLDRIAAKRRSAMEKLAE